MNSLKIDVYCVRKTWIQELSSVIQLTASNIPPKCFMRTLGDEAARTPSQYGVEITLTDKAEEVLLDGIPANNRRLCAIRL